MRALYAQLANYMLNGPCERPVFVSVIAEEPSRISIIRNKYATQVYSYVDHEGEHTLNNHIYDLNTDRWVSQVERPNLVRTEPQWITILDERLVPQLNNIVRLHNSAEEPS